MSGFMLDVDRLLASELVALGTPEECWHALMLWCRAWQQSPPGSLPNDDRILAAFSRAGSRWKKVREMALRGFVLCSDGRLYHRVMADQVMVAWAKRSAYRKDQERLKKWREDRRINGQGNAKETPKEMDVKPVSSGISEPDRQGQGQGHKKDSELRSAQPDIRERVWQEGVPIVRSLTGLAESGARSFVGKLVKEARDDCSAVFRALREAESLRPINPQAWLTRAVVPRLPIVERTEANPTGRMPTHMPGAL